MTPISDTEFMLARADNEMSADYAESIAKWHGGVRKAEAGEEGFCIGREWIQNAWTLELIAH